MDAEAVARSIRRVAVEIVERTRGTPRLGLVGVRTGGVPIASRIAAEIKTAEGRTVPVGVIDITLYRDDAASALPDPKIGPSEIDFEIKGWDVVLVDDVLNTGRTIRAAIDCLLDYGRPRRIWLAVLCDRGGRELPVAPDFVGRVIEVPDGALLDVVAEGGPKDKAAIRKRAESEEEA
jgi:pyrimidine operon attenuation protein/uracil phosphoribosyltransferase